LTTRTDKIKDGNHWPGCNLSIFFLCIYLFPERDEVLHVGISLPQEPELENKQGQHNQCAKDGKKDLFHGISPIFLYEKGDSFCLSIYWDFMRWLLHVDWHTSIPPSLVGAVAGRVFCRILIIGWAMRSERWIWDEM
jgi:hypothetical protein